MHKSKQINFGNFDTNQTVNLIKLSDLLASYLGFVNLLTGCTWFRLEITDPFSVMIQFFFKKKGEENNVINICQKHMLFVVCEAPITKMSSKSE
jgi:hypothetical protein